MAERIIHPVLLYGLIAISLTDPGSRSIARGGRAPVCTLP